MINVRPTVLIGNKELDGVVSSTEGYIHKFGILPVPPTVGMNKIIDSFNHDGTIHTIHQKLVWTSDIVATATKSTRLGIASGTEKL